MSDGELPHGIGGRLGREAGRSDQGKRIVHTVDPDFLTGIGRVSAFGAQKYHMRNFLMAPGMAWGRVFDSLMGHLMAHWGGEDIDEESGQPHILMAGWNLMVLHTYWHNPVYHPGDDRPSKVEYQGRRWEDWEAEFRAAIEAGRKADAAAHNDEDPSRARWRDNRFGYWLPVEIEPGHWVIVMERTAQPPVLFIDEMDEGRGYKMDEDEALDRARSLNAMNFSGYDACHEHWLAKPLEEPKVKDPAYFNDPVRAFFAAQNSKEQGSGG